VDLEEFKNKSIKLKNENQVFLKKLKLQNPRKLDDAFHELHEDVFEKVDCLTCANCCKTTGPLFTSSDIKRISSKLKLSEKEFVQKYLLKDFIILNKRDNKFITFIIIFSWV
jgi:hypothetical protein